MEIGEIQQVHPYILQRDLFNLSVILGSIELHLTTASALGGTLPP